MHIVPLGLGILIAKESRERKTIRLLLKISTLMSRVLIFTLYSQIAHFFFIKIFYNEKAEKQNKESSVKKAKNVVYNKYPPESGKCPSMQAGTAVELQKTRYLQVVPRTTGKEGMYL